MPGGRPPPMQAVLYGVVITGILRSREFRIGIEVLCFHDVDLPWTSRTGCQTFVAFEPGL